MSDRLLKLAHTRFAAVLALGLVALTGIAWYNRFIQDDAFISFRYAENLARGHGLVWNPGERVEGYTNFLWTLLLAGAARAGFDLVAFSLAAGLGLFLGTLLLTFALAHLVFGSRQAGLFVCFLLGTNYTFSAYATGGLETQLQTFLFAAAAYLVLGRIRAGTWSIGAAALLSLLFATAVLTRLDSAVLVAVLGPLALLHILREKLPAGARLARIAALALPCALLVGGWLAWKLSFYGGILPNTYYAKVSSVASSGRGILYVYQFLASYWLLPFPFLALLGARRLTQPSHYHLATLAGLTGLWLLYVMKVGGDFMEFRFIVPVLPFIMILIRWVMGEVVTSREAPIGIATACILLVGSLHHLATFQNVSGTTEIETVADLQAHVLGAQENWAGIGKALGEAFPRGDVSIAVAPAGAIPYYSRLPAVDMLGLSDPWVARHGEVLGTKPGHQRHAPPEYLIRRGVNLVIGHPRLVTGPSPTASGLHALADTILGSPARQLPPQARILEIPIQGGARLAALYLTPCAAVEEAIGQKGWRVHDLGER